MPSIFHGFCRKPVSNAEPCCEWPGSSSARTTPAKARTKTIDCNALTLCMLAPDSRNRRRTLARSCRLDVGGILVEFEHARTRASDIRARRISQRPPLLLHHVELQRVREHRGLRAGRVAPPGLEVHDPAAGGGSAEIDADQLVSARDAVVDVDVLGGVRVVGIDRP